MTSSHRGTLLGAAWAHGHDLGAWRSCPSHRAQEHHLAARRYALCERRVPNCRERAKGALRVTAKILLVCACKRLYQIWVGHTVSLAKLEDSPRPQ